MQFILFLVSQLMNISLYTVYFIKQNNLNSNWLFYLLLLVVHTPIDIVPVCFMMYN